MSLPGPTFAALAVELLLLAIGFGLLGEAIRRLLARWSTWLARARPIERVVLDLYLGGGALYVLAALPIGLFYPATAPVVIAIAAVVLVYDVIRVPREGRATAGLRRFGKAIARPMPGLAIVGALALFLIELAIASTAATGNTFDSSALTGYVAQLLSLHTIPHTYLPTVALGIPYPQGTTVWLAAYQTALALPPARTSLLVTPLFFGLAPLGAYAVGDRVLGKPWAGATLALVFAFVGSWTRVLVGGSNDFVFAFPLVLLLLAWTPEWAREEAPRWGNAIAFGGIAGIAAALNPAGPIWLFLVVLGLGALARPIFAGNIGAWFARWLGALSVGAAFALPSLVEEVAGAGGFFRPGLPPGAALAPAALPGLTSAQFIGLVDPYLFRTTDVWFSPFPVVRAELAILLTLGVLLLLWPLGSVRLPPQFGGFGRLTLVGGLAAFVIVLAGLAERNGLPALARPLALTSLAETSILLCVVYTLVAAVPILALVSWVDVRRDSPKSPAGPPFPHTPRRWRVAEQEGVSSESALFAAFLLFVPGVVTTAASLAPYETDLYTDFGNVTPSDFDLLEWAETHVPSGARVLVAPGSAAGFLSGYVPNARILFPMDAGGVRVNASYALLVSELTNGTLDANGTRAMSILAVNFVAVTGANSILFRPFLPAPLLGRLGYAEVFHEGDAYVFERSGS